MGRSKFLKLDQNASQNLASAPLSFTTDHNGKPFILDSITLKASVAITETVTIRLDSYKGANYDTILPGAEIDMVSENDLFYNGNNLHFNAGDEIKVECTNDGTTGTVYVLVKTREVS